MNFAIYVNDGTSYLTKDSKTSYSSTDKGGGGQCVHSSGHYELRLNVGPNPVSTKMDTMKVEDNRTQH